MRRINAKSKIGLFVSFGFIFVLFSVVKTEAASLYFSPSSDTHFLGRTFNVSVNVSSPDAAMNAAQGTVSFPTDKVEVISISKAGSIINLWVQEPSFSNRDGVVNFAGVVTNPGFQGTAGKVITITFRANSVGKAPLSFLSGSVLANDGKGTELLSSLGTAAIQLKGPPANFIPETGGVPRPVIASDPAINSTDYYRITSVKFSWKIPHGVDGVEYGVSQSPDFAFPKISKGAISEKAYDLAALADGIWYFSVHFKSGSEWGAAAVKAFRLDRTPPEPFSIRREDNDPTNSQPKVSWSAADKTSGIAYYRAKIGDGDWFDPRLLAQSDGSYTLPPQSPGSHVLAVRAYDNAGNLRETTKTFDVIAGGSIPGWRYRAARFFSGWGWLVIIAILFAVAALYYLMFHLFASRRRMRAELKDFKAELTRDLKRLEARLEKDAETGLEVDLKPAHLQKAREALRKEVEHVEQDIKKEIEKLDDFSGK